MTDEPKKDVIEAAKKGNDEQQQKDELDEALLLIVNKQRRGYLLLGMEDPKTGGFRQFSLSNDLIPPALAMLVMEHGTNLMKQAAQQQADLQKEA